MKKPKHCNIMVQVYDNKPEIIYECVQNKGCQHVRHFSSMGTDDDEDFACVRPGCVCGSVQSITDALKNASAAILDELIRIYGDH